MTDKIIISRKEIEALQRWQDDEEIANNCYEDDDGCFILYDDLRALLDKAEVVRGEAVAQVAQEGFGRGQVYWHKKCPPDGTDLYTTPQPSRIAELEATRIAILKSLLAKE